ncbi:tail fiber domain-containing protein [Mucilaginibacter sp.]|uniref:tail fiber domain-containing protein n=1 Tax=Mucilaginibacter sp. TaxID=1882438 RepID=UPI003AFF63D9
MKINQYYKILAALVCVLLADTAFSQNVGISSSSSFTPDASAGLDVSYTNKGLLMPRVALTATNAAGPITSPAISLLVYNTATAGTSPNNVVPGYYYWNGTAWTALSTGAQSANTAWSTTGNTGTSYPTNFLGTKDNNGLHFLTNSLHRFQIDTSGSVAVGLNPIFSSGAAREKFLVDAGSTTNNQTPAGAFNLIAGRGYLDNYLQLNIQNNSPTASASTDIVASNDAATETANFIDMGINSSANNTTGAIGGPSTAYLYGTGNDMAIGNGTPNKNLIFFTGGISPSTYTERIRLDASGRVGIGTNAPTSDLTLFQSSGTGGTKGFRFAGNSIGAVNSGTGFLMSLGYNGPGNKQLWLGDPDYSGNSTGTFVRFGVVNGSAAVFDAVSGDNSVRRYLTLGVGGDPNSGVIFGNDNNPAAPGSMVWTNGNMSIGNGYRANAAPANGLIVQSKVGIGNNAPTEILDVTGNLKFSGALMPNNDAGTSGYFLQSSGSGTAPTWVNPSNAVTSQAWSLAGNSGTTAGTNFIGTTDATDFVVKTNNAEIARFNSVGNVGIGSSSFNSSNPEQLLVDAGTASSYNVISGKGRLNNYLQLNIQNTSAGGNASSDIVASNNTATESVNYVDLGINSSGNTSTGVIGGASTAYLYGTGNDFAIGNGTSGKNLLFFTGGTGSNERMRIDGSGNVGIGTTPSQKLDVNGNINAASSIFLDGTNSNTGTKTPGLYFGGSGSGEVIASKRTTGTDQYGIDFYTSSNLRMSVTNNGNVGIGTITPGSKLTVAGDIAPATDAGSNLGTSSARWSNIYAANGTINTSDKRLKTNIKNLNYGLKEILALQPVSYNWKKTPQTDKQLGLIAQDVRKIVPEVVVGDEAKENLGMKYAELVPVLINAIKEQQKEIDDLKKAVQKLQK